MHTIHQEDAVALFLLTWQRAGQRRLASGPSANTPGTDQRTLLRRADARDWVRAAPLFDHLHSERGKTCLVAAPSLIRLHRVPQVMAS